MNKRISIIGAGISGITTALTLQLLGYETVIYAKDVVDDDAADDPRFASLYPAASVIPHSVQTDQLDLLFPPSQQMFQFLLEKQVESVKLHRHYELYEEPVPDPSYRKFFDTFRRIDDSNSDLLPHRKDSGKLNGWVFDCLFTEFPDYIKQLYAWYRETGGTIIRKALSTEEIKTLETKTIINCSGIWSSTLFEDEAPRNVIRGHLLHIKDAPMIFEDNDIIPSYNYTPKASVYSDPTGAATDVYFYPRSNGWILGGSRQPGIVTDGGVWEGKTNEDTIEIGGMNVPRQIHDLNREILKNTYGIDLTRYSDVEAKVGYRFIGRQEKSGLRLEESSWQNKRVIHNYGHGGAGVTLSWGCALKVAQMIWSADQRSETIGHNLIQIQQEFQPLLR